MKKVIRQVVYCDDCGTLVDNLSAVESFFGTCTNGRKYFGVFIHDMTNGHFELIDCTNGIFSGFYSVGEIKFENYASATLAVLEQKVSEMVCSPFTLSSADEDLSILFELFNEEC